MTISDRAHTILERSLRPRKATLPESHVALSQAEQPKSLRNEDDEPFGVDATVHVTCEVCGGRTSSYRVFDDDVSIQRCEVCETESLQPIPSAERLRAYYNGYETTQTPRSHLARLIDYSEDALRVAMESIGRKKEDLRNATYLEIGFGNGSSLFAATRLGAQAVGLDLDPTCVTNARSNSKEFGQQPHALICGDMDDVIATGQKFDYVKASHVIEHTRSPRQFLSQILQVQSVGGVLLLECPNNKALFWIVKNLLRKSQARENFYNSLKLNEHLWGFTRASLPLLLESIGYEVLSCHDYAVGDTRYQPETAIWYPTWERAMSLLFKERNTSGCKYAAVRQFDTFASRFAAGGTCLAVGARKKPPSF